MRNPKGGSTSACPLAPFAPYTHCEDCAVFARDAHNARITWIHANLTGKKQADALRLLIR